MISTDISQGITIITLVNFEYYNSFSNSQVAPSICTNTGTVQGTAGVQISDYEIEGYGNEVTDSGTQTVGRENSKGTLTEHQRVINCNKDNKDNKENKEIIKGGGETLLLSPKTSIHNLSFDEREEKFINDVNNELEFDIGMRERFISYWTEPDRAKTSLRYEDQKYFDIKSRLKSWEAKDVQFAIANKMRFTGRPPKGSIEGTSLGRTIQELFCEIP
ncbi:MAG: hypothetical protein WCA84_16320 [Ignavibacteriaceae bacterium]